MSHTSIASLPGGSICTSCNIIWVIWHRRSHQPVTPHSSRIYFILLCLRSMIMQIIIVMNSISIVLLKPGLCQWGRKTDVRYFYHIYSCAWPCYVGLDSLHDVTLKSKNSHTQNIVWSWPLRLHCSQAVLDCGVAAYDAVEQKCILCIGIIQGTDILRKV